MPLPAIQNSAKHHHSWPDMCGEARIDSMSFFHVYTYSCSDRSDHSEFSAIIPVALRCSCAPVSQKGLRNLEAFPFGGVRSVMDFSSRGNVL